MSPLERRAALGSLDDVTRAVVGCERCPRLRAHCRQVAEVRKREFRDQPYWGRPVPGFGDRRARLLIVGLAPAAHGANRTGRMFTGDSSGDWLHEALHRAGFASQPHSVSRDDGLRLTDAWVTAAARCAPPGNRPTREELACCRPFLEAENALLTRVHVVLLQLDHVRVEPNADRTDLLSDLHNTCFGFLLFQFVLVVCNADLR